MVSQRASTGELNPGVRAISRMHLPPDYFLEIFGVGHLLSLTTPQGLTEHHQGGLPARCCRLGDARPPHIPATTLTTEPAGCLDQFE